MNSIHLLDLNIDIDRLLLEYEYMCNKEKTYSDHTGSADYWKVIRHKDMTSEYCKKFAKNIKEKYNISGKVDARFYRLLANQTLPWHIDRGTECSINIVLSDSAAPIMYKINDKIYEYEYTVALINTQLEHSVINGSEDRILFKISIFDEDYNAVRKKITD